MQKITYKDFSCWCDSYRAEGNNYYQRTIILLSLFGNYNEVRAIWAALIRGQQKRSYVEVMLGLDTRVSLGEDVRFHSIRRPLARQSLHMVLLHPTATTQVSPFSGFFYLIGENPQERYFPRMSRMCQVPLRPTWQKPIWDLGLESGKIKEVQGFGIPAYAVSTEEWEPIITTAIKDGKLK